MSQCELVWAAMTSTFPCLNSLAAKAGIWICFSWGTKLGIGWSGAQPVELLGDGHLRAKGLEAPNSVAMGLFTFSHCIWLSLPQLEEHGWVSLAPLPSICPTVPPGWEGNNCVSVGFEGALEAPPLSRDPSLILRLKKCFFPAGVAR